MKASLKSTLTLLGLSSMALASNAAVVVTDVTPYDPATYWNTAPTAGLDFDDASSTQAGFLGVPASNNKTYDLVHNGITFDIDVINADQANQNRNRGGANGGLVQDFEQWYGINSGTPEASIVIGNLVAFTDYAVSFFTYNAGAGQMVHNFYEGTSSAAPFITTFTTAGNAGTPATFKPGVTFSFNTGSSTSKAFTIQAVGQRITLDGIAVVQGATIPEPGSLALLGLGGLMIARRRRN